MAHGERAQRMGNRSNCYGGRRSGNEGWGQCRGRYTKQLTHRAERAQADQAMVRLGPRGVSQEAQHAALRVDEDEYEPIDQLFRDQLTYDPGDSDDVAPVLFGFPSTDDWINLSWNA